MEEVLIKLGEYIGQDTYRSFPRKGLTKSEVVTLIEGFKEEYGLSSSTNDPYKEAQNLSPTVGEFLCIADDYGEDHIKYIGYVILPPRSDFRVSIEGFIAEDLPANEMLELVAEYRSDEFGYRNLENGLYWARFWWD